jgi:hypothetical protein
VFASGVQHQVSEPPQKVKRERELELEQELELEL